MSRAPSPVKKTTSVTRKVTARWPASTFRLGAGTDIAPLLKGLENDLCQSPHWGYLIEGEVTVTYTNGTSEVVKGGDLFYWPPGHTVRVGQDAEIILFSPQHEHGKVLDHLLAQLSPATG